MAKKAPLVSCIVPVYNGERYLAEALESILAQSHPAVEVIVVDDGSTDASVGVAERYSSQIALLRRPKRGQAAACNAGIAVASGSFLAFLDADDLWHPYKLSRQLACFDRRSDLDYSVTHIRNFLSPELARKGTAADSELDREAPGFLKQTLLAKRGLFERIGTFDASLCHAHDTEWFVRARSRGAVLEMVPEVLAMRRIHLGSHSQRFGARSRAEYLRLVKGVLDRRRGAAAAGARRR